MSTPTPQPNLTHYLSTSVDDLRSSLSCELAHVRPETVAASIAKMELVLQACNQRTKAKVIETHIRALEKLQKVADAAKSEPAQPKKGVRTLTLDALDVMPSAPAPANDEWANARHYASMAEGGAQVVIVAQIMCGFELIELRKRHGTNQGKRRDLTSPNDSEKLDWPDLVKAKIGRSDDTARNWMAMAKAVQPRLKKLDDPWEAPALLALPPSEWPEGAREEIAKTLENVCDGQTQADWMKELGLTKPDKARKGGKTEKGDESEPEKPEGWTDEDWERYLALPAEQREAVDLLRPLIDDLAEQGDPEHTAVPHLPARERKELEAAHRRLGEILSSLKGGK